MTRVMLGLYVNCSVPLKLRVGFFAASSDVVAAAPSKSTEQRKRHKYAMTLMLAMLEVPILFGCTHPKQRFVGIYTLS